MATMDHSARARVTVTLEIDVGSNWGADCTVEQVYKQGAEEAVGRMRNVLDKCGVHNVRIIENPMVTAILTERKR